MANRNNATRNAAPADEPEENKEGKVEDKRSDYDDDDIPESMDDSQVKPRVTSAGTNGNTSSSAGMSLEELDERGFDEARDERIRAAMDPPSGDWFKIGRWEWEKRNYTNDTMPDDIDPAGRTFFQFTGEVESRTMGEHTYTPKLFLRISPDVRFKVDKPEEIDIAHKLWLRAKDLYLKVKLEKPTIRKLVMFLAEDDYIVRTMKGDSSPITVDVRQKVERRQASRR